MVKVLFDSVFEKQVKKIKDAALKTKIKKQIGKLIENPELGKPMRYSRKGTREVYVPPFRLSYHYDKKKQQLTFLDLYHKDQQ